MLVYWNFFPFFLLCKYKDCIPHSPLGHEIEFWLVCFVGMTYMLDEKENFPLAFLFYSVLLSNKVNIRNISRRKKYLCMRAYCRCEFQGQWRNGAQYPELSYGIETWVFKETGRNKKLRMKVRCSGIIFLSCKQGPLVEMEFMLKTQYWMISSLFIFLDS